MAWDENRLEDGGEKAIHALKKSEGARLNGGWWTWSESRICSNDSIELAVCSIVDDLQDRNVVEKVLWHYSTLAGFEFNGCGI